MGDDALLRQNSHSVTRSQRRFYQRFMAVAAPYWLSNKRAEALTLLFLLVLLLLGANLASVGISYAYNYSTTALKKTEMSVFVVYLFISAALNTLNSAAEVLQTWITGKLQIRWRTWLTTSLLAKYFVDQNFFRINTNNEIDNPDERLQKDLDEFTYTTLLWVSRAFNSITTLVSFLAVLWLISTNLVLLGLLYAIGSSIATIWIGRRLINVQYCQRKLEADYRYGLVHVRKNVESIAFFRGEKQEIKLLSQRFQKLFDNYKTLIAWERHMQFVKEFYEYIPMFLPVFVLWQQYFGGLIEIGTIVQAGMAFKRIQIALGVIPSFFGSIASLTAVLERIDDLSEAIKSEVSETKEKEGTIALKTGPLLRMNHLTLLTPDGARSLIQNLSLEVPKGEGLLIAGQSGAGKSSLLRSIAGLWTRGEGEIVRPASADAQFLPQCPYMVFGSLRDQLLYPQPVKSVRDEELHAVLLQVNLADLPGRVGGLDTELRWKDILSPGEQQRLAFARLLLARPQYAFLDEATSALDAANEAKLYAHLKETGTTFVSVSHSPALAQYHKNLLNLSGGGAWTYGLI